LNEKLINRFIIIGEWDGNIMIKVTDHRKGYWAEAPLTKEELWKLALHSLGMVEKNLIHSEEVQAFRNCLQGIADAAAREKGTLQYHMSPWMVMSLKKRAASG